MDDSERLGSRKRDRDPHFQFSLKNCSTNLQPRPLLHRRRRLSSRQIIRRGYNTQPMRNLRSPTHLHLGASASDNWLIKAAPVLHAEYLTLSSSRPVHFCRVLQEMSSSTS